jgi:hypothetical protein
MLLRFRFSNFRSFRDEQELSLVAAAALKETRSTLVFHPRQTKEGVLPVAATYGANASGKTNVIRALWYVVQVISDSYRRWKPDGQIELEPFLGGKKARVASRFEIDFLLDGIRHSYGFRLDSRAILEEWLFVYPKSKKQSWFYRRHGKPISFSAKMPGANKAIEALTRKNSLFLSAAAQNNHDALMPIFGWFSGLRFVADAMAPRHAYSAFTAELCAEPRFAKDVARLLRAADIGIVDLKIEKEAVPEEVKKVMVAVAEALHREIPSSQRDGLKRIRLVHRLGEEIAPFMEGNESAGTLAYLRVLGPVLKALGEGAVLCVDELDARLHPILASQIIQLFNDPSTNRKGAQLIFNTHDATLLSRANLRRDQIWFTEKGSDGSSHLYPLTDFKPRQNENLENGYLQGRYGAIPFLSPRDFLPK